MSLKERESLNRFDNAYSSAAGYRTEKLQRRSFLMTHLAYTINLHDRLVILSSPAVQRYCRSGRTRATMPDAFPAFYSIAAAVAGMMSTAATAAGVGMSAAGFGAAGIVKGSVAAFMESLIGNISAGGLFAGLQSFGAVRGFEFLILIGLCGTLLSYLLSLGT
jgi:hypothetical protein